MSTRTPATPSGERSGGEWLVGLALFALWPFTRLVHAFAAPLGYLFRPYIVYRSRSGGPANRPPRRGWERPELTSRSRK